MNLASSFSSIYISDEATPQDFTPNPRVRQFVSYCRHGEVCLGVPLPGLPITMNLMGQDNRRESVISNMSHRSEVTDLMDFNAINFAGPQQQFLQQRRHSFQPISNYNKQLVDWERGNHYPNHTQNHFQQESAEEHDMKRRKLVGGYVLDSPGLIGNGNGFYFDMNNRRGSQDEGGKRGTSEDILGFSNSTYPHHGSDNTIDHQQSLLVHHRSSTNYIDTKESLGNLGEHQVDDGNSAFNDLMNFAAGGAGGSGVGGQWGDPNNFDSNLKM